MAAPSFDEDDILALGADVDPAVFAQLQAALNDFKASVDQTNAKLEQAADTSAKLTENLSKVGTQATAGVDQAKTSVAGLSDQLAAAAAKAEDLNRAMALSPATEKELGKAMQLVDRGLSGAGTFQPEQSENPDIEPPGLPTEPTKTGSMFAVGHALSVAGHSLGMPGLREAGAFVYMEEGFKRVQPLLSEFGTSITGLGDPTMAMVGLLGPAAIAIGAVAIALVAFNQSMEANRKSLHEAISSLDDYYKAIQKGTTESIKKQIEDAKEKLAAEESELKQLQDTRRPSLEAAIKQPLGAEGIAMATGQFKEMDDRIAALQKSTADAKGEIDGLNRALDSTQVAANDQAELIKQSNQESVERIQREADLKKQEHADSQMTSEAAKKRLDMLKDEKQSTTEQMAALQPFLAVSEEASKKYAELYLRQKDETQEISDLEKNIIPLIAAREHEAEVVKQTEKDLTTIAKAHEDYNKSVAAAEVALANQIETAQLRETQAEAKARQDTSDRIADIRTNLGEKEQQLATNYNRSIFDDRTKFYNDWAKLELKASEDSQDNQIEHIQKLKDIQARSFIDDQQALLDRNFLQLAKNQLGRQTQTQQEENHYNEAQQALQRHLQYQQLQLANNLRIQEEQDRRQYERKLADAETLAANDIAQQHTLEARKLAAIRQGLDNEIALYRLAEQQKLAIMLNAMNAIIAAANADLAQLHTTPRSSGQTYYQGGSTRSSLAGSIGAGLTAFAEGGSFSGDEPFMMSEAGPETLNIGGRGYNIPGAAMVYPMQGGNVEKGASTHSTYAPTNNFYESHDMAATQRMVEQVQQRQLKEFFGA